MAVCKGHDANIVMRMQLYLGICNLYGFIDPTSQTLHLKNVTYALRFSSDS